ncbi:MAG: alpha/beta hydrolase [Deltaproteobacteria bacterium]|nr:alpha/beta hydrolase [Deltaproteobacteria bacterium]
MTAFNKDFSKFDRPEILQVLFHPRPEFGGLFGGGGSSGHDVLIPVEEGVAIGGRFHVRDKGLPNILFFHGNGEIVADYDEMGPLYNRLGINFLPVDYRGYGRSGGEPSITGMMQDCHEILEFVTSWLSDHGYNGPLVLMGRSLGSASVLELAAAHPDSIAGLIIESGFAYAGPLLRLLGVDPEALGFTEEAGFNHIAKIKTWHNPLLIIHAQFDHIIPFSDGQALFDACPATDKTLVMISDANHNDLFLRGLEQYLTALGEFVKGVGRG